MGRGGSQSISKGKGVTWRWTSQPASLMPECKAGFALRNGTSFEGQFPGRQLRPYPIKILLHEHRDFLDATRSGSVGSVGDPSRP